MILNLMVLNQHIEKNHFKMDRLWSAERVMTLNCVMASLDLKDAFYQGPIAKEHPKYLFSGRVFSTNTHACPMGFHLLVGFLLSC